MNKSTHINKNDKFFKKIIDSIHCPTCKSKLNSINLIDIFTQGLVCRNNHRFFIELECPVSSETAKSSYIKVPVIKDRNYIEIIKLWLTNIRFRSKLNNQLATIIRRIYEISQNNLHINYDYKIFQYCTFCKNHLQEFEQDDIWVQGLKCKNNHKFFMRNGIGFSFDEEHVDLQEDMADKILYFLIKSWLKGERIIQLQLHEQIKLIINDFLRDKKRWG